MKKFNTTGICIPAKHYMVDISERLAQIRRMVDEGDYFTINRARQYGKTTTLFALENNLKDDYVVVSFDFQGIGAAGFATEEAFVKAFSRMLLKKRKLQLPVLVAGKLEDYISREQNDKAALDELFDALSLWCDETDKPLVLMIDEVDSASNNQVFLDFLAQLRMQYLEKQKDESYPAFQSVILAGVTDIKHLKSKIRDDEAHKVNSPWNIAADFNIDMSLSEAGIRGMLEEYESDHNTGMDTALMARRLREYTSGYPYLVSRLCQLMDEMPLPWFEDGLDEAIKMLLADGESTLFNSLMGRLENSPHLKTQLRDILMKGEVIAWQPDDDEQKLLVMYGFIRKQNNTVVISNRIFEMRLYQYFLGESRKNDAFRSDALINKSIFIMEDGSLNMPLILEHFVETQRRVHGDAEDRFLEEEGRERFLTYIAPIINGTGTFSIEEQTRDKLRMDVVIHYLGKRYVVELKIWRGPRYNEAGEKQVEAYLDYFGLSTGYMVSFCFNKNKDMITGERTGAGEGTYIGEGISLSSNKDRGCKSYVKRVKIGERTLFEAIV